MDDAEHEALEGCLARLCYDQEPPTMATTEKPARKEPRRRSHQFNLRLKPQENARLQQLAQEQGVTPQEAIRRLLTA